MIIPVAVVVALAALFYTLFVRDRDIPEPIPVSPIAHLEDRKRAIYETFAICNLNIVWVSFPTKTTSKPNKLYRKSWLLSLPKRRTR